MTDLSNIAPETLLETFPGPSVLINREYRIVAANLAYSEAFGAHEPVVGEACFAVSHGYDVPCDLAGETCPLRLSLDSGQRQCVLHVHHTPDGGHHVDVEIVPIRDRDGNVVLFLEHISRSRTSSSPGSEGRRMVGRSAAFNQTLELVRRVAPSQSAVLLMGESGTGKELAARAVHQQSQRAQGPFVPVECSGLSETLFESELFGHAKGAFTGAIARTEGLVAAARDGTLFLDEIGDIPLSQQVKLLRLLETGTYRSVGSVEVREARFRLVCATNRDLKELIATGAFRRDLYYRISAFPIRLPPLRERMDDLPLLVAALLEPLGAGRALRVNPGAMACLQRYGFPGNIRELRNILEYSALLADGDTISAEHLPDECVCSGDPDEQAGGWQLDIVSLEEMERRYLIRVLARYGADREALARRLGISERTLYRKLKAIRREADERLEDTRG